MGYRVAVVGATGNVGREILGVLSERGFPADEVVALASRQSVGKEVSFGDDITLAVQALEDFDFSGIDFGLFSPGSAVSRKHAPRAADSGCVVIDNTSEFRMDEDVPLIVPEVNGEALADFRLRNIIANPNCSTIQMVMALKPLQDLAPIKRIVVSTYQSVSGAGKGAMDELFDHTRAIFMNDRKQPKTFAKTIAFNVIPQIDSFMDDGSTREETKMVRETQKILDPDIAVSELLAILKITKQSLSRVLSHLMRDDFVVQKRGKDRRRRLLSLTPKGADLERLLTERQSERIARAYREAGAEAVAGFRTVLRGIINEEDRRRVDDSDFEID